MKFALSLFVVAILVTSFIPQAFSQIPVCLAPDDTTGTVEGPIHACDFENLPEQPLLIIDGLPPGDEIELQAMFMPVRPPSIGSPFFLSGEEEVTTEIVELQLTGTGALAGFNRVIQISSNPKIAESDPRTAGDPVQTFPTELMEFQGTLFGDPDFDSLQLTIGQNFGLPSPGETTLTDLGNGDFVVVSFFDIEYQIDFQGAPGSILDGFSGTTQGTTRIVEKPNGFVSSLPGPDRTAVGGEMFPVDTTALLLAASYSTASWMIPLMIAVVGFGIIITHQKSKLKHNSCPSCKIETEDFFELGDKVVSKCDNPKCRVNLFFIRRYRNSFN